MQLAYIVLACDGCGTRYNPGEAALPLPRPQAKVRADAAKAGWARVESGGQRVDLCVACKVK